MVVFATPACAAMDSTLTARKPTARTKSMAVCKIALWRRSLLGRPCGMAGITSRLPSEVRRQWEKISYIKTIRIVLCRFNTFRSVSYLARIVKSHPCHFTLKENSHEDPCGFDYWRPHRYRTCHSTRLRARRRAHRYFRQTRRRGPATGRGTPPGRRVMLAQGSGSIINVSSTFGQTGGAGASVYAASKHAVEGLTKSAALEAAGAGVRVNAVAPGPIDTGMLTRFTGTDERKAGLIAGVPLQRVGRPEEIAQTIVFLASDKGSFITGATIAVDGGKTAL